MDRNELAARFAVADYGAKCRAYYAGGPKGPGPDVYSGTAEDAFKMADLFLDYAERIDARPAKSTLTPAPVPPPAGKYEPRVGDVVRFKDSTSLWVVDGKRPSNPHFTVGITDTVHWSRGCCNPDELTYVRPSTDAEKRAAGLAVPPPAPTPAPECPTCESPKRTDHRMVGNINDRYFCRDKWHAPTPAPEAKRPTLADVERSAEAFANHKGDIPHSPSDAWMDGWLARDRAVAHDGIAHSTNAPCPPPVAGSGATLPDNVREFLLDVEYAAKWANQPQGPAIEYVKGRLKELAARAHDILTSPVRP